MGGSVSVSDESLEIISENKRKAIKKVNKHLQDSVSYSIGKREWKTF